MQTMTTDARFWDGVARTYARDPIKDMVGYERTLARVSELLGPRDRVLEIGCGTGMTAVRLAGGVGEILATDVSNEMIVIAQDRVRDAGCKHVRVLAVAAEAVDAAAETFDAVLAFSVLHLLRDRERALAHMHRLLRPGGLLISKTPCLREMSVIIRALLPVAQWVGKAPHVTVFSAAQLEADVTAQGFEIIERARHGSGKRDPRLFLVARKSG